MNLTGTEKFKQSNEVIWKALHDVEILKGAIPGCQSIVLGEDGEYDVSLKLGVAAVKGEYEGKVKIEDVEEYGHYILTAEGSGSPGHINAEMDCKLHSIENGCKLE